MLTRIVILFSLLCLSHILDIPISAQTEKSSEGQSTKLYTDSTYGFSLQLPTWFNVLRGTYYPGALDVKESDEFSFSIFIRSFDDFPNSQKKRPVNTNEETHDLFAQIAEQAAYQSLKSVGPNGESYGRVDSIKEYKSISGLRVLAIFRTQVVKLNDGTVDANQSGPLYCIDISDKKKKMFMEFDYFGFDMRLTNYRQIAESIALSVKIK